MMIDEEFLFAVAFNDRVADGPLVYITPRSFWDENQTLAETYTDNQYAILYSMTQDSDLLELAEGIYQPRDPYLEIDDIEWSLQQAGFVKDDNFIVYVEECEIF